MNDMLNDVIHALFKDSLKGKFMVEVKASIVVDADNLKDAQDKALEIVKKNPNQLKAWAMRLYDDNDRQD